MQRQKVFCALDMTDVGAAFSLAQKLQGQVAGVKLGLEFFSANGPGGVQQVAEAGLPIFLDLKLHDIPNTVAKAIGALMPLAPAFLTLHATGGRRMLQDAAAAAKEAAGQADVAAPKLLAVTVMTSLDAGDLSDMGVTSAPQDQVVRLARLAQDSGIDGIVCSPLEISAVRAACGPDLTLMVPGIRPAGSARGDQKRVMTPKDAAAAGADFMVIGRPITEAPDPAAAAADIARELADA